MSMSVRILEIYSGVDEKFDTKYKVTFEFDCRRELVMRRNHSPVEVTRSANDLYCDNPPGLMMRKTCNDS